MFFQSRTINVESVWVEGSRGSARCWPRAAHHVALPGQQLTLRDCLTLGGTKQCLQYGICCLIFLFGG